MSDKRLLNDGWRFTKQALGQTLETIHHNTLTWQPIDIPHDWLIYNVNDLYETSEGWYQRTLSYLPLNSSLNYSLRFEGVYMDSTLFINGEIVGEWKYGYSTFEFDITKYLTKKDNEILVRVIHQSPNSRWYSGAGIYRNVWLKTYPSTHLTSDGIYISPVKTKKGWEVQIATEVSSLIPTKGHFALRQSIYHVDQQTKELTIVAKLETPISFHNKTFHSEQTIQVTTPKLWDIASPNLYTLQTELLCDGNLLDTESNRFGFRTAVFTPNEGFFLNDRHVKIYGTCEHHDLGCLGAAMNRVALERELKLLMKMGVNAIRTSHNMPAVELMELADELGLLIDSEGFDMWERSKTTYDYARFFSEWVDADVASWIRRDRNHPSIILWSIGNEIYDTHVDDHGQEITKRLLSLVHKHDYRHNAPVTIGSNYMPWENAQKCADIIEVAGYNYGENCYEEQHKKYPNWRMYGSETSSTVQSRGIYHFPHSQQILCDADEQCSSLGNSTSSWGAKNSEYCIIADRDATYSAGQFIWTGFDYIGEPNPYSTKNSYFGQIDTAGFCKDSFYLYQAEWTSYKDAPMVHIFPYWDYNEGQEIDVRVCSNAPKVELFFNDLSQGTFEIDHQQGKHLTGNWKLPYQVGTLKAVAYNETDVIIATDVQTSFGDAVSIVLAPDKTNFLANGEDLVFVEITMTDSKGNEVCNANNRVEIIVTGEGRLIGLDNGDSTDFDEYKGTSRRLFSGKLLAVIASTFTTGEVLVTVTSIGLAPKVISLQATTSNPTPGVSATTRNSTSAPSTEIPVRKLEIISPSGTQLNETLTEIEAFVKLYPENATYQEVEWSITNEKGIASNLAALEVNGDKVKMIALGSGRAILRCSSKNGADKVRLISQLAYDFTGLSETTINPYVFVYGGLYSASNCELTDGIEHGIATTWDKESYIGFQNMDFGSYGSDEITIPVYSFEYNPINIKIYQGIPGEKDCELLADVIYDVPPVYNLYQEKTYKLSKRMKGLSTICFVIYRRFSIKGFQFTKLDKAYAKLTGKECDSIHGDTFTMGTDSIKGIGNNVVLEYKEMDFGPDGLKSLTICGHSPIERNTLRVQFNGEQGTIQQLAEFMYSDDISECTFDIPNITGLQTVSILFLPGSNFDMEWIQFHK
jgi:beta-galactosidase